jgi:hypothetical protein
VIAAEFPFTPTVKPVADACRSKYSVPPASCRVISDPAAPNLNQTPTEKSLSTPIEKLAASEQRGVESK